LIVTTSSVLCTKAQDEFWLGSLWQETKNLFWIYWMALLHLLFAYWLIHDWCLGKNDIQFCSHVVDQHVCLHCLPVSARTHLCHFFTCSITHGLNLKFEILKKRIQKRFCFWTLYIITTYSVYIQSISSTHFVHEF